MSRFLEKMTGFYVVAGGFPEVFVPDFGQECMGEKRLEEQCVP